MKLLHRLTIAYRINRWKSEAVYWRRQRVKCEHELERAYRELGTAQRDRAFLDIARPPITRAHGNCRTREGISDAARRFETARKAG
jgi:hypothetical protein